MRVADDEADAAVAKAEDMPRLVMCGLIVVDHHHAVMRFGLAGADQDRVRASAAQAGEQCCIVAQRRRQEEAIAPAFDQALDHARLVAFGIAAFDHEVGVKPGRGVHAADAGLYLGGRPGGRGLASDLISD